MKNMLKIKLLYWTCWGKTWDSWDMDTETTDPVIIVNSVATHTWSSSGKSSAVRSFSTRAVSSASTWVTHFCNSRIWLSDSWASWTEPSSNRVRSLAYKAICNQALATARFQIAMQCRMYRQSSQGTVSMIPKSAMTFIH